MPVTAQAFLDMKEENARQDLQEHVNTLQKNGLTRFGGNCTRRPGIGDHQNRRAHGYGFDHLINASKKRDGRILGAQRRTEGGAKDQDTITAYSRFLKMNNMFHHGNNTRQRRSA